MHTTSHLPRSGRFATTAAFGASLAILVSSVSFAADLSWKAPSAVSKLSNPLGSSSASTGRAIYQNRCVTCHGSSGHGDGPDAADLGIHPPDLTSSPIQSQSDGAICWKITTGKRPMPSYGKRLSQQEIWAVVSYLRTLGR